MKCADENQGRNCQHQLKLDQPCPYAHNFKELQIAKTEFEHIQTILEFRKAPEDNLYQWNNNKGKDLSKEILDTIKADHEQMINGLTSIFNKISNIEMQIKK